MKVRENRMSRNWVCLAQKTPATRSWATSPAAAGLRRVGQLGLFGAKRPSDTSAGDLADRRRSLSLRADWLCSYNRSHRRHGPFAGPDPAPAAGNWLCFAEATPAANVSQLLICTALVLCLALGPNWLCFARKPRGAGSRDRVSGCGPPENRPLRKLGSFGAICPGNASTGDFTSPRRSGTLTAKWVCWYIRSWCRSAAPS